MPVWIPGVEISFKMLKKGSVQAHEAGMFFSRDVEAVFIKGYYAQTILFFVQKNIISNKHERISKHESSSRSVKVVANVHVGLQFCGKAALKRHIISYKYRASEASEGEVHFVPFFHQKY